jgi:hypothetical protein
MGFMLIDLPPGEHEIRMVFELPLENLVGRIVSALAAAVALMLLVVPLVCRLRSAFAR